MLKIELVLSSFCDPQVRNLRIILFDCLFVCFLHLCIYWYFKKKIHVTIQIIFQNTHGKCNLLSQIPISFSGSHYYQYFFYFFILSANSHPLLTSFFYINESTIFSVLYLFLSFFLEIYLSISIFSYVTINLIY